MIVSANVPEELKQLRRWVISRPEEVATKAGTTELRKPPRSPHTGELVHSVFSHGFEESDFGTLDEAIAGAEKFNCGHVGICFANTNYRGFDYDKAIDKLPKDLATSHIVLCDSYSELSLSGSGMHVILHAPGAEDKEGATKRKYALPDGSKIEVFYEQYFICTGRPFGPIKPIRKVTPEQFEALNKAAKSLAGKTENQATPTVKLRRVTQQLLQRDVAAADSDDTSTIVGKAIIALLFDSCLDLALTEKLFKDSPLYKETKWGKEGKWERLKEDEFKRALPFARELLLKSRARQSKDKTVYTTTPKIFAMSAVKAEVLEWLWPEKIPLGCLTLFAGMPGLGKSLMTTDLMARGSAGRDFVDQKPNVHGPFSSLLLAIEDDKATVTAPRLMAAGADLNKIMCLDMVDLSDEDGTTKEERAVQLDSDINMLRSVLEADRAIKLVVIDPITNYMGNKNVNSSQEFRDLLMPIAALAQELGISIIAVIHNTKQQGRDALSKIGGSISGIGVARIGWGFMEKDENTKLMLLLKKNLGNFPGIEFTTTEVQVEIQGRQTPQALIEFQQTSKALIENVIQRSEQDSKDKIADRCQEFLKAQIPRTGEVLSKLILDAAEAAGLGERSVIRARTELGILTHKKKDGWYWKWPAENQTTGEPSTNAPSFF